MPRPGTVASPADSVLGIGFFVDGVVQGWWFASNRSLAPGETLTISSNDGPNGGAWIATAGSHTIQAYIDDAGRIAEGNESNNTMSITVVPPNAGDTQR